MADLNKKSCRDAELFDMKLTFKLPATASRTVLVEAPAWEAVETEVELEGGATQSALDFNALRRWSQQQFGITGIGPLVLVSNYIYTYSTRPGSKQNLECVYMLFEHNGEQQLTIIQTSEIDKIVDGVYELFLGTPSEAEVEQHEQAENPIAEDKLRSLIQEENKKLVTQIMDILKDLKLE